MPMHNFIRQNLADEKSWQNFARSPVTYLYDMWAGSDVDRYHHWEESVLFNNAFQTLQLPAAS